MLHVMQDRIKIIYDSLTLLNVWRRSRDSNSRTLSRRRFSRPVPSTTRPLLRNDAHYKQYAARCKAAFWSTA